MLIGSTQKMGTGTNVQKRLVALHHLDAPWKPAEVEQREGRILRQGNENEEVAIYRYVTEGSFDAYMWQALETKARRGFPQIQRFNLFQSSLGCLPLSLHSAYQRLTRISPGIGVGFILIVVFDVCQDLPRQVRL